ncbi:MAG: bifunctional folylpolyglutamate synthase/dihydrofolate synthase [Opitutaceae bacterium]|jgi:dihydrofolate synthase/folylpolyglutamate synthase|nr:bifunctional folylpolyglutamate synthase/dihydrofolate synthase [Opitutaceae bacterium]
MAVSDRTDFAAAREWLLSLKAGGVRFGVDRMALLAAELGHPEDKVPAAHIAGTNGKGSVAAMLEAILRGEGLRTGLYTSPHLVGLGERVQVNRAPLAERALAAYAGELGPVVERLGRRHAGDRPSFFEVMTAVAFLEFARRGCDAAVVETGLGGRLDATNILKAPVVSVITSIGLDHCEFLGDSLAGIAREKAGIIKEGGRVVLGRLPEEAERVARQVAAAKGARVWSVREAFGGEVSGCPETNLEGEHQRWNAAAALLAARRMAEAGIFLNGFSEERARESLKRVVWDGRWQRLDAGGRTVVLDAAHNAEGAAALDANLRRLVAETGQRPVMVMGATGAARARALLEVAARRASAIVLVEPAQERACGFGELEGILRGLGAVPPARRGRVGALFGRGVCRVEAPAGVPVVVSGSIYLVGEALALLEPERGEGQGGLQDF